jgi:hypothetical protein
MTTLTTTRGGAWLIEDTPANPVFTPERLSDEHRLIGQTADEFMANEVLPALERLEQKDWDLARRLVRRAGELGLLGTDVAESFGGVGLDKIASIIVGEAVDPHRLRRHLVRRRGSRSRRSSASAQKFKRRSTSDVSSAANWWEPMLSASRGQVPMRWRRRPERRVNLTAASRSAARRCGSRMVDSPISSSSLPRLRAKERMRSRRFSSNVDFQG